MQTFIAGARPHKQSRPTWGVERLNNPNLAVGKNKDSSIGKTLQLLRPTRHTWHTRQRSGGAK